jgi:hypothetical protein
MVTDSRSEPSPVLDDGVGCLPFGWIDVLEAHDPMVKNKRDDVDQRGCREIEVNDP